MTNGASFEITDSGQPGVRVLGVRGEIDVATSPEMRCHLVEMLADRPELVIVDLTDVTFIDSTGLGVLVEAVTTARAGDGDLRLVVTQPKIIKLIELTGLDQVFSVVSSANQAVGS